MSITSLDEYVNDPELRAFLSEREGRIDEYVRFKDGMTAAVGDVSDIVDAFANAYAGVQDPDLRERLKREEGLPLVKALRAFRDLRDTAKMASGGEQTADKIVAGTFAEDWNTFYDEFRRTGDASQTTLGSIAPAVAQNVTGRDLQESLKPGGEVSKSRMDKYIARHPEAAGIVEGSRPQFEEYAGLVEAYYHAAAGRSESSQALVEQGAVPTFEEGQKVVTEALRASHEAIVKKKEALPAAVASVPMPMPSSRPQRDAQKGERVVDLFPAPPPPNDATGSDAPLLSREFPFINEQAVRASANAFSRGLFDAVSFGDEQAKGEAALRFPRPVEATHIGPGGIIPLNNQAWLEFLGLGVGWAPLEAVAGPVGGAVGAVTSGLPRILSRFLSGAAHGGTIGALNPSMEPTDVKGRAAMAGGIGVLSGALGVGGAVVEAGRGGRALMEPASDKAAAMQIVKKAELKKPSGTRDIARRTLFEKNRAEGAKYPVTDVARDVLAEKRAELKGKAKRTPVTEQQKAQIEAQLKSEAVAEPVAEPVVEAAPKKPTPLFSEKKTLAIQQAKAKTKAKSRLSSLRPSDEEMAIRRDRLAQEKEIRTPDDRFRTDKPSSREEPNFGMSEDIYGTHEASIKEALAAGDQVRAASFRDDLVQLREARRKIRRIVGRELPDDITEVDVPSTTPEGTPLIGRPAEAFKELLGWVDDAEAALMNQPGMSLREIDLQLERSLPKLAKDFAEALNAAKPKAVLKPPAEKPTRYRKRLDQPREFFNEETGKWEPVGETAAPKAETATAKPPVEPPKPPGRGPVYPEGAPPEEEAVGLLLKKLKSSKKVRESQDVLYSEERGKRIGEYNAQLATGYGREAFIQARPTLKGELPKAEFTSLDLPKEHVDALFEMGRRSSRIAGYERIQFQEALDKLVAPDGMRVPAPHELDLLYRVFGEDVVNELMKKGGLNRGRIASAIGASRALKATLDMSATLRQGAITGVKHPRSFGRAFLKQFKHIWSDKQYAKYIDELQSSPEYLSMRQNGLALTAEKGPNVKLREEEFMFAEWAELRFKKLGVLQNVAAPIRISNRAYSVFLTELRRDVYKNLVKSSDRTIAKIIEKIDPAGELPAGKLGKMADKALEGNRFSLGKVDGLTRHEWEVLKASLPKGDGRSKMLGDFAQVVNWGTGRGDLGRFNAIGNELSTAFFAPRFVASRLRTFDPRFYMRLSPLARKEAVLSSLSFMAAGASVMTLAWMRGAKVGRDPLSADFGKIVVGDPRTGTRFDVWGGHSQYPRIFAQFMLASVRSSKTGQEIDLTKRAFGSQRAGVIGRAFRSKTTPAISAAINMWYGEDFKGDPTSLPAEVIDLFIPLIVSDIYAAYQTDPSLLPGVTAAAFFGIGTQTYSEKELNRQLAEWVSLVKAEQNAGRKIEKARRFLIDATKT